MLKSIFAGIMISIAAIVNVQVGGGILGAVLFAFGLITICAFELNLFTGKCYLLADRQITIYDLVEILYGNILGCVLVALIYPLPEASSYVCALPIGKAFLLAIVCGFLMSVGVMGYKRTHNFLLPAGAVVVFILTKSQHSIAQMAYMALSDNYNIFTFIAIIAGNLLGGLLPALLLWDVSGPLPPHQTNSE